MKSFKYSNKLRLRSFNHKIHQIPIPINTGTNTINLK